MEALLTAVAQCKAELNQEKSLIIVSQDMQKKRKKSASPKEKKSPVFKKRNINEISESKFFFSCFMTYSICNFMCFCKNDWL